MAKTIGIDTVERQTSASHAGVSFTLKKHGPVADHVGHERLRYPFGWPSFRGDLALNDGDILPWYQFRAEGPTPDPFDTVEQLTSLSTVESRLDADADTVEQTYDDPEPTDGLGGSWGQRAALLSFDVFASQHAGTEPTSTQAQGHIDWSGCLALEQFSSDVTFADNWVVPWYEIRLPELDMTGRNFEDTFVQFGNFVEAVAPPHAYTDAVLLPFTSGTRTPSIHITPIMAWTTHTGKAHVSQRSGPWASSRLPAELVLTFVEAVVSTYVGDDTAATLDGYSTTP